MNRSWMVLICFAVLAAACGPASVVQVPSGYVALDEDELSYDTAHKYLSADGAVIVVREREHEPEGSLEFWAEALEREITEGRGYSLLENVETKAGRLKGTHFKFKGSYQEQVYLYDIALFVTEDLIVTVETAALEEQHARHKEAFAKAIQSLRLD